VADLVGVPLAAVATATTENAVRLLLLPPLPAEPMPAQG